MKKIIILGDSWGVPNYCGTPGILPEEHTEWLLRDRGYDVLNCAGNGRSNFNSIKKARDYVALGHRADWIVWFHTDMILDKSFYPMDDRKFTIKSLAFDLSERVYQIFNTLVHETSAKTIVFGASSPLLDNFDHYVTPTYKVQDLRSKIVGYDLPMSYGHHRPELLEHPNNIDTVEDKLALIDAYNQMFKAMGDVELFPDRSHPGIKPHQDITKFIIECIEQ